MRYKVKYSEAAPGSTPTALEATKPTTSVAPKSGGKKRGFIPTEHHVGGPYKIRADAREVYLKYCNAYTTELLEDMLNDGHTVKDTDFSDSPTNLGKIYFSRDFPEAFHSPAADGTLQRSLIRFATCTESHFGFRFTADIDLPAPEFYDFWTSVLSAVSEDKAGEEKAMDIIRTTVDKYFAQESNDNCSPHGGREMIYEKLLAYAKDGGPEEIEP